MLWARPVARASRPLWHGHPARAHLLPWGGTPQLQPALPDNFANPKSRIFACPRVVTKMFAGLMSR